MAKDTVDGFYARPHTDGFFAPDGTWVPVGVRHTAWSTIAKPTRGAAPDGFMDDSGDGFFARPHTDGFFASDGTWVPVVLRHTTWSTIPKPS